MTGKIKITSPAGSSNRFFPSLLSALLLFYFFLYSDLHYAWSERVFINEDFDSLSKWVPVLFPKIDRHSEYTIGKEGPESILVAKSNASASGLRYIDEFNVYEYPVLRWRWKIDKVYAGGDLERKSGDDFPLRVYVTFKYDPEEEGLGDKIVYGVAKAIYGEYPPNSSLSYVWANKEHEQKIYPSAYTDKARLIIVRSGRSEAGSWMVEEANIIDDYKKAFGHSPPATASLAIMNDSDNTGESSVSYLDYIRVLRKE